MVNFDRLMAIKVWKSFSWLSTFQKKQNKVILMIFWAFLALLKNGCFGPISGANLGQNAILSYFWGKTFISSAKIEKSMHPNSICPNFPKNSCNLEYFCTLLRFLTPKADEIQGVQGEGGKMIHFRNFCCRRQYWKSPQNAVSNGKRWNWDSKKWF